MFFFLVIGASSLLNRKWTLSKQANFPEPRQANQPDGVTQSNKAACATFGKRYWQQNASKSGDRPLIQSQRLD
jgi:hypothetical protein